MTQGKFLIPHSSFLIKKSSTVRIAIIDENTLAAIGLAGIIRQMMPAIEVCLFTEMAELIQAEEEEPFHHFFVSTRALTSGASFFIARGRHTIVLTHGAEVSSVPCDFPTLNVCQSEGQLTRAILRLAERSHAQAAGHPHAHACPAHAGQRPTPPHPLPAGSKTPLTPRETQVLRGIVLGQLNKEIADSLGVSTATIISHRKNITEKLHQKSVSGLTIYAVMHGIVRAEEI